MNEALHNPASRSMRRAVGVAIVAAGAAFNALHLVHWLGN